MARPSAVRGNINERNCHDHDDGDGVFYNCNYYLKFRGSVNYWETPDTK